jgi:hypothetical protein
MTADKKSQTYKKRRYAMTTSTNINRSSQLFIIYEETPKNSENAQGNGFYPLSKTKKLPVFESLTDLEDPQWGNRLDRNDLFIPSKQEIKTTNTIKQKISLMFQKILNCCVNSNPYTE